MNGVNCHVNYTTQDILRSICACYLLLFGGITLYAQPQRSIDSLKKLLITAQSPQDRMMLNWSLAEAWWQANPDSALYYSQLLYNEAYSIKDTVNIMNGLRSIAISYDYAYRTELAKKYYDSTYYYASQVGDSLQIANYNFNMGTLMISAANFIAALPYYETAIELYSIIPESEFRLAVTYTNLAYVYRTSRRFEDAVKASKKALSLLKHQPHALRQADFTTDLADAFMDMQAYDSAEFYYNQVYTYAKEEKDEFYLCSAANGLGIVAFAKEEYEKAKQYFTTALQQETNDPSLLITIHGYLGAINSITGNQQLATHHFSKAHQFIDEKMMGAYTLVLYKLLSDHYARYKNFEKAFSYLKRHETLNEQFTNRAVIDRTAEWERRYATQEKEMQISELLIQQQQLELEAKTKSNQLNIFIISSISFGIIALIVGYFYTNRKKAAAELQRKNYVIEENLKEKELLMREIHHRVKNNLQVITSLLSLQTHFSTDNGATSLIQESKNRVHAMSLIHQSLYQQSSVTEVNIRDYIDNLLANLEATYQQDDKVIEIKTKLSDIPIDVDLAIPLGLIINELVTNAFKHAFTSRHHGTIEVSFTTTSNDYILLVADDGVGFTEHIENTKSLGTILLRDLSKKLRAKVSTSQTSGYHVSVTIPTQQKA